MEADDSYDCFRGRHAVAARAGCSCVASDRHSDGAGVDATIRAKERFAPDSILTQFSIDIQMKATSSEPTIDEAGRHRFELTIKHYDKLRDLETAAPIILVVLFLPSSPDNWLNHSEDGLVSRRCAYWVSLRGAPESSNRATKTIAIPQTNVFSSDGLRTILTRVSRGEDMNREL
jgi:Domain of unknown function (DUF4365)